MFRVGQKVVNISGGKGDIGADEAGDYTKPKRGQIYTIATLNDWGGGRVILTLVECDNSHLIEKLGCRLEPGFGAKHFRPIVERKIDISIFKKMLLPASKERVDVRS